jgi:hypothetical protein
MDKPWLFVGTFVAYAVTDAIKVALIGAGQGVVLAYRFANVFLSLDFFFIVGSVLANGFQLRKKLKELFQHNMKSRTAKVPP